MLGALVTRTSFSEAEQLVQNKKRTFQDFLLVLENSSQMTFISVFKPDNILQVNLVAAQPQNEVGKTLHIRFHLLRIGNYTVNNILHDINKKLLNH